MYVTLLLVQYPLTEQRCENAVVIQSDRYTFVKGWEPANSATMTTKTKVEECRNGSFTSNQINFGSFSIEANGRLSCIVVELNKPFEMPSIAVTSICRRSPYFALKMALNVQKHRIALCTLSSLLWWTSALLGLLFPLSAEGKQMECREARQVSDADLQYDEPQHTLRLSKKASVGNTMQFAAVWKLCSAVNAVKGSTSEKEARVRLPRRPRKTRQKKQHNTTQHYCELCAHWPHRSCTSCFEFRRYYNINVKPNDERKNGRRHVRGGKPKC